ncbi:MAG: ATP-binding cassette domain-containing protein [Corynebacterium sp.]|uniref:ABC transporter ATP-binding protein n=1 Tax=Corynebacterium sp. TaxID=1720 RepID=UPI0026DD2107|nr:ATP-binding cassette domain-containing protein [Corynebacterium sp.]MDO4762350.1 ATP-binding cassette domain-containing protein [Corynebacterium sp.]
MAEHDDVSITIDCSFGYESVIGEVTMEVHLGEFIAVTGANGSGKSTLISTIAGECEPREGIVRVVHGEHNVLVDPATPSAAGCVTRIAEPQFFPDLTLGEHIFVLSRKTGIEEAELLARTQAWQLDELPNTFPSRLSSGQRQRAHLGMQLAVASPIIVLDEPERHMDSQWVKVLCQQIRQKAQSGSTIVVATHSPDVVETADWELQL